MSIYDANRTYIIGEIGINHNGDVNIAKELIDVASSAGCDAVKFQKRTVDIVYSDEELARPRESPWGSTNRDQKYGLEFGFDEYCAIDEHCRLRGIEWFASCWDIESVDFIEQFDVRYHKIASAMLTDDDFVRRLVGTRKRLIMSTGMSSESQIRHALDVVSGHRDFCRDTLHSILHCTSTYPTKPSEMNMLGIRTLDDMLHDIDGFDSTVVGFSNHYSGIVWAPIAVSLGARVIEFHMTLDRTMYGSDQAASIEPHGVRQIVEHVRLTEQMLGDGQLTVYDSEIPIMNKLRRC